jgi:hypothetical protein
VAGQGQGPVHATGTAPAGAGWCGPGQGVAGAAVRGDLAAAAARVKAI